MTTLWLGAGLLCVLVGVLVSIERVTRWWERRRQGRLQVDPDVRRYMRRRSDERAAEQRRVAQEEHARQTMREG